MEEASSKFLKGTSASGRDAGLPASGSTIWRGMPTNISPAAATTARSVDAGPLATFAILRYSGNIGDF